MGPYRAIGLLALTRNPSMGTAESEVFPKLACIAVRIIALFKFRYYR